MELEKNILILQELNEYATHNEYGFRGIPTFSKYEHQGRNNYSSPGLETIEGVPESMSGISGLAYVANRIPDNSKKLVDVKTSLLEHIIDVPITMRKNLIGDAMYEKDVVSVLINDFEILAYKRNREISDEEETQVNKYLDNANIHSLGVLKDYIANREGVFDYRHKVYSNVDELLKNVAREVYRVEAPLSYDLHELLDLSGEPEKFILMSGPKLMDEFWKAFALHGKQEAKNKIEKVIMERTKPETSMISNPLSFLLQQA